MMSVDLQDAYFQIPIHPESRKYLHIVWESQCLQFKVVCFWLSTALQVFVRAWLQCHQSYIQEEFVSFVAWTFDCG